MGVVDGADWIDVTCSPKALGSGRWTAMEVFIYSSLEVIESYVMDCVTTAGSQHCPPVVIGVSIRGSRLHPRRGLLQLLDQPLHQRPAARRWPDGAAGVITHRMRLPLSEDDVRSLRAGDLVILDGEMTITAGLPTHQRIQQHLDQGKPLPVDLHGGALFHLGSYSQDGPGGFQVLYMNPTTSTRFNCYMPGFIRRLGLRAVGGKGGLDRACAAAVQEAGCVYLSFLGRGCPLLSEAITGVVSVHWTDLTAHFRLATLRVAGLGPLTVDIAAHGNSLYDTLHDDAAARLPAILAALRQEREERS